MDAFNRQYSNFGTYQSAPAPWTTPQYGAPLQAAPQQYNPAQLMGTLRSMMSALVQLSAGWQAFGAGFGSYGPVNNSSAISYPKTNLWQNYGPVSPNPSPFSLLPAAQTSQVSYTASPTVFSSPIQTNPSPYGLLPAGQSSVARWA